MRQSAHIGERKSSVIAILFSLFPSSIDTFRIAAVVTSRLEYVLLCGCRYLGWSCRDKRILNGHNAIDGPKRKVAH